MRKIKLETYRYYHVYNRGAHKDQIFKDDQDRFVFLKKVWLLNNELGYTQRDFVERKIKEVHRSSKVK